jgi:prepilin signal peptidase PulO-like enzyme (type II secretory pathway)
MTQTIRLFLLFEAATFVAAALIHFGVLLDGHQHREAAVAESVIAAVLLTGSALTWIRPAWTRRVGLGAQGFALLGTLVGLFTIAIGIGPRTVPDIVYHIAIVVVLVWGLVVSKRTPF